MENTPMVDEVVAPKKNVLFEVTTLSKTLAAVLFVILPFVGFWLGYNYDYTEIDTLRPETQVDITSIGNTMVTPEKSDIDTTQLDSIATSPSDLNTIYAVERDQFNLCTTDIPQRLVRSIANQDGTRATTTLFTNLISELQSAGIQTNSKQEWNILSASDRGDFIFLYANSPCAEKMTMSGPTVSLNLKSNTFMLLTTPFQEFHWLEPWVVSPDGTKIAAVTIGFPSEDIGIVRIIDLLEDKVTDLARAPEGTELASWCEISCAHYHLKWIDNDTIEYGIYKRGYIEDARLPIEIRKVNLP